MQKVAQEEVTKYNVMYTNRNVLTGDLLVGTFEVDGVMFLHQASQLNKQGEDGYTVVIQATFNSFAQITETINI